MILTYFAATAQESLNRPWIPLYTKACYSQM